MSRILLPPWNADWFGIAFSQPSLQLARTRSRLPEAVFPGERLAVMGHAVLGGIYQPQEPLHIELAREGKAPRILTIPQPPDRLLQAAFAQVLTMQLDPQLSPQSFAYRPKLSPMQALHAALAWIRQGLDWIVRADIRSFFDQISPALLCTTIGQFIDDQRARTLLQSWLQKIKPAHAQGIAQGAPISPLLSNLYLDALDRELTAHGIPALRYADDLVLFASSQGQAEQQLGILTQLLRKLALELASEKTMIGSSTDRIAFLGQTLGQIPQPPPKSDSPKAARPANRIAALLAAPRKTCNTLEARLRTLYLDQPGGYLKLAAGRLILTRQGKTVREFLLQHLDLIIARGHLALSSAVLLACQQHHVSLIWLSPYGRVLGVQAGSRQGSDMLRAQCRCENDAAFSLRVARCMVSAKIDNQRLVLKRYARTRARLGLQVDGLLKRLATQVALATSMDVLRGIEGLAARDYFAAIGNLLPEEWGFHGRGKRPARDAVNAMLSFGYSVLYANTRALLEAVGMNPDIGILHASRAGHAALASDLMEEFRALVVDSTVLKLVLNRHITPTQFNLNEQGEMRMADEARIDFLHALEQKMNAMTSKDGPDYRRAIAAQAHKLRAVVLGEATEYQAFRAR